MKVYNKIVIINYIRKCMFVYLNEDYIVKIKHINRNNHAIIHTQLTIDKQHFREVYDLINEKIQLDKRYALL